MQKSLRLATSRIIKSTFPVSAKTLQFLPKCIIKKEQLYQNLDCAETFNNFFASVFNTTETTHDADFRQNALNWFRIDQSNVNELLQKINIRKSTGPDGIGNIILKKAADGISKPLILCIKSL